MYRLILSKRFPIRKVLFMAIQSDKYSVLYKIRLNFIVNNEVLEMSSSDIVSIAYICNYDTMTHPIIRARLYTDLSNIQMLCDDPDDIYVKLSFDGNMYKVDNSSQTVTPVSRASSITFQLKGYIETKNIPSSKYDQYKDGVKSNDELTSGNKFPFEVYCYNAPIINKTKSTVPAIYKNMSILTAMQQMLSYLGLNDLPAKITNPDNQTKYDQILIPNLDFMDALTFLDRYYGIYKKGTQVFFDLDALYIVPSDVEKIPMYQTKFTEPILISSASANTDLVGYAKENDVYKIAVIDKNVSVLTETDIEKVINGSFVSDLDFKSGKVSSAELDKKLQNENKIITPHVLHPYQNDYVSDMYASMINERITRVDLSTSGVDVFSLKINTHYNLIFQTPIRGFDINRKYRASYATHVFSNMDSDLFQATSTFKLCSN